ncbi:MAG TPA: sigma-70 family RNA polymerase sigma factor [Burkholderiales bacterium]|jgi:RNA polymerase sigma-70 factor (ECF subfamily)|nr:sigma-70 family RNA polymerase sigma factor [Burkholderiales bacterium]
MATSPEQNQRLSELLAQASRRDDGSMPAFELLYQGTSSKLFGVALRILRREDWAEEVLQECYVSIWKHCADYQLQLSAPMTWMTSIVRNRCLDVLRRPNFEDPTDDDAVFESFETDEPGPLALLEQSVEAKAIARCLGGLEAKQQQAIRMAFFEGLTHVELAQKLNQPLGTVKTWVRRGLMKLKDCLAGAGIESE